MLPRPLYSVFLFLVLHGIDRADEVTAFTSPTAEHPLKVKVVVVAMFEVGADAGDVPGEFQYWVERRKLSQSIPLPAGYHDVRTNGSGLIGTLTGMGTAKAATSIMALGLDPRFDFSQAYWLVAGIAGIDPNRGTVGSAVWADYVVDGDLAHEIDAREIPKDWPDGFTPLGKVEPFEQPRSQSIGEVYPLNRVLVLRTACNFDSPPPGVSAAQDLRDEKTGNYSAYLPSLDAAFTIGNRVVGELLDHWDVYSVQVPQSQSPEGPKSN
jgi:purine nucleoside permease